MLWFIVAMEDRGGNSLNEKKDVNVCEEEEETLATDEAEIVEEVETELVDSEVENSDQEIRTLKEENEQLKERTLRLQAEFENYKRRTDKEKSAAHKYKVQELAIELLPIIDNFERALQTEITEENKGFFDGINMVYEQLQKALQSQGIEPIESINKEFDPNLHHAVMQIEDGEFASNTVIEELQKGYMLKDRVIRPAMVKVNK